MLCVFAVAPPGFRYADGTAIECANGYYNDDWDRSATCTPCGSNPATGASAEDPIVGWKSDRLVKIPIRNPHTGFVMTSFLTRGNSSTCCKYLFCRCNTSVSCTCERCRYPDVEQQPCCSICLASMHPASLHPSSTHSSCTNAACLAMYGCLCCAVSWFVTSSGMQIFGGGWAR